MANCINCGDDYEVDPRLNDSFCSDCRQELNAEDWDTDNYFSYPDDDDPPDEEYFDCGWVPDGGFCEMAGTEDCDFECPYHDYYYNNAEITKTTN